jgi:predicted HD phosphohydrolase
LTEADDDLIATSEAILHDIGRMRTLEEEKQTLATDDPRVDALSAEIVVLAHRVAKLAGAEEEIANEADESRH